MNHKQVVRQMKRHSHLLPGTGKFLFPSHCNKSLAVVWSLPLMPDFSFGVGNIWVTKSKARESCNGCTTWIPLLEGTREQNQTNLILQIWRRPRVIQELHVLVLDSLLKDSGLWPRGPTQKFQGSANGRDNHIKCQLSHSCYTNILSDWGGLRVALPSLVGENHLNDWKRIRSVRFGLDSTESQVVVPDCRFWCVVCLIRSPGTVSRCEAFFPLLKSRGGLDGPNHKVRFHLAAKIAYSPGQVPIPLRKRKERRTLCVWKKWFCGIFCLTVLFFPSEKKRIKEDMVPREAFECKNFVFFFWQDIVSVRKP